MYVRLSGTNKNILDLHCLYLSVVRYYETAILSGIAKIWSFYEESRSNPNLQTADMKSGIWPDNLGLLEMQMFC